MWYSFAKLGGMMKSEKIIANSKIYYEKLVSKNPPERINDEYIWTSRAVWLKHACWLAQHIPSLVMQGRIRKAVRWQSCIQGILLAQGIYSVKSMKEHNMPDSTTYDRNA